MDTGLLRIGRESSNHVLHLTTLFNMNIKTTKKLEPVRPTHSPANSRLVLAGAAFLVATWCCPIVAAEAAPASAALADAVEHARAIVQKEFAPKVPGVSAAV